MLLEKHTHLENGYIKNNSKSKNYSHSQNMFKYKHVPFSQKITFSNKLSKFWEKIAFWILKKLLAIVKKCFLFVKKVWRLKNVHILKKVFINSFKNHYCIDVAVIVSGATEPVMTLVKLWVNIILCWPMFIEMVTTTWC